MRHVFSYSVTFSIAFVLLCGCSETASKTSYRDGQPDSRTGTWIGGSWVGGTSLDERERPASSPRRLRWELWAFERDALGEPLQNTTIARGDAFARNGDRKSALKEYEAAMKQPMSGPEREGLTMRIAGVYLTLDDPERALSALSNYFRTTGRGVGQVGPRFSLLFGYAYARKGDYNQSLAWLSRSQALATPASGSLVETEDAIKELLSTLDGDDFEKLAGSWTGDIYVHTQFGVERNRRTYSPEVAAAFGKRPFWSDFEGTTQGVPDLGGGLPSGSVGVLLPLTGQFASLGVSVKNGIEIAREGSAPEQQSLLVVRDSLGSPTEAVTQARQLLADSKVSAVLGPLLTEEAIAVSEVMVRSRVPMVSFSKRSDFRTGGNIFRIAPTAESQVASLAAVVINQIGMKRFAIVSPEDPAGQEFTRLFKERVIELGGRIVYEASYAKDNAGILMGISQEVERSGAEGLFFPDSLTAASRFFPNISEATRKKMRPLGLANWDNPRAMIQSAHALQGAMFVSPFYADSARPMVKQFVDVYKAKFRATPDFLAAQGFDTASMLLSAFGTLAPGASLAEALHSMGQFEGVTGQVRVNEQGEFDRIFTVVELGEGKLREVGAAEGSAQVPTFRMSGNNAQTESSATNQ